MVHNATGSGTGSGAVSVNAGGTLGGDGRISGNVSVSSNGTLAVGTPDNPTGTLTILGSLTTTNGSTLTVNVSSTTNGVISVGGNIARAGTLTVAPVAAQNQMPNNVYVPILVTTTGTITGKLTAVSDGYAARLSTDGKQLLVAAHRPGFIFSAQ